MTLEQLDVSSECSNVFRGTFTDVSAACVPKLDATSERASIHLSKLLSKIRGLLSYVDVMATARGAEILLVCEVRFPVTL